MSTLILIRHGQASFMAEDYDQLSPLGVRQAQILGEFLARRGEEVTEVFVGPRKRHHGTAAGVEEAFRAAGLAWPEPVELPGLDEHNAVEAVARARKEVARQHPHLGELARKLDAAEGFEDRKRAYGRLFGAIMEVWRKGELPAPGIEDWDGFQSRVRGACEEILGASAESGRRVLAFTSGGPVAVAVRMAVGAADSPSMALAGRVVHTSRTRILFQADRMTLDTFNDSRHLDDPELETHL